jgi:hypothetical protein
MTQVLSQSQYFSELVAPGPTATGFLSLSFFKGERGKKNQQTCEELKQNTRLHISNVTEGSLNQAASNTRKIVTERGANFQHVM